MDRRWRRHLLEGVRGVVPYMAVNVDGTLYFFATSDPKSGQTLFVETSVRRDQAQLRLALHALDDIGASAVRDVFLDVGAHIGTTTLFAVRHLDFAEAVAVEPSVDNMLLLRLNVLANGLEGVVQTVRAAASNQNGLLDLDVGGLGSEYHHLASGDGTAELRQLVPTTTLDALAARGVFEPDRVGLLWMDIEGHEVHALEGASALLERRVPLVVEFCREKLERAGTLGRVPELLSAHYSRILDLREPAEQSQFLPVQEIGRVIDAHYGHRRGRCVDVLVC
jgi:FkbM family methyltransferase